jgi:hypothetical protein
VRDEKRPCEGEGQLPQCGVVYQFEFSWVTGQLGYGAPSFNDGDRDGQEAEMDSRQDYIVKLIADAA